MSKEVYILIIIGLIVLFGIVVIICQTIRDIKTEENMTKLTMLDIFMGNEEDCEDEENESEDK